MSAVVGGCFAEHDSCPSLHICVAQCRDSGDHRAVAGPRFVRVMEIVDDATDRGAVADFVVGGGRVS
jgi:hypothetical protein